MHQEPLHLDGPVLFPGHRQLVVLCVEETVDLAEEAGHKDEGGEGEEEKELCDGHSSSHTLRPTLDLGGFAPLENPREVVAKIVTQGAHNC